MINYLEWSYEYRDEAERLRGVMDRIKSAAQNGGNIDRAKLNEKLTKYRGYYADCVETAKLLEERYRRITR